MKPLSKIAGVIGSFFTGKTKFYDQPTVTGGFEIFRNLSWEDGMSQTKQLNTYKKSLYVFACVSKIAQKTASIDFELFKIKSKQGDKEEVFVHEGLDLLYRPNPFQTKTEFFEKFMINKKLAGEAFILKVRDNRGVVRELWNLRPDYMTIVKDKELFIKGYEFHKSDGKILFAPEDIIHDAYPNPLDDYGGMSALWAAETRVDTEGLASTYQKNFFKNNARPDFLLSSEGKIDARQKEDIKEKFEKRHKGSENSGKGAFLEGGLKYQQVSISQREMDFIESMKFTRDDILTAFGVPKPIVAITDDVNLANAKTAMEIFLSETIQPEIVRLTEKLNEHLIYPEYGEIFFIHFDEGFMPRNEKEQNEINEIQLRSGVKVINEVREDMGLAPLLGGWSLYMPAMQVAVGGLPQPKPSKAMKERERSQKMKVFRGRGKAMQFLEYKELAKEAMYEALHMEIEEDVKKGIISKKEVKKPFVKTFVPKEVRGQYADMVNKAIDKKGDAMKPKLIDYGEDQKKRVLAELRQRKSLDVKALDGMFDKPKENKLLSELALPFISEFLMSAGEEAMETVNPAEKFEATERVRKFIKARAKEMAKQVNDTTIEKLSRTLSEGIAAGEGIGELTDRVELVYQEYPTYRAEMIARTEATTANNQGFMESYAQSGVANAKEWIATNDSRTREEHVDLDGEVVQLDEKFSNGLDYPQEPNCRCVIAPAFKE